MSKIKILTTKEKKESASRISNSVFMFTKKKIQKELDYLYQTNDIPDMNDVTMIIVMALILTDANIIKIVKEIFEGTIGRKFDVEKAVHIYVENLCGLLKEFLGEQDELKEGKEEKIN